MSKFGVCEACDTVRLAEDLGTADGMLICNYNACDTASPWAICGDCEEVFPADDITNGGEEEPWAYRCEACHRSHWEDLREAREAEQDYRATT